MRSIKRGKLRYYFKKESVIVHIPYQHRIENVFISFNCYSLHSRIKFYKFVDEIRSSKRNELQTIDQVYSLATRYGIRACQGYDPRKKNVQRKHK